MSSYYTNIGNYIAYGPASGMTSSAGFYGTDSGFYYQTDNKQLMQYVYGQWIAASSAGFPLKLRNQVIFNKAGASPATANFVSTPTSGDFLVAIVLMSNTHTVNTPSGWTLWNSVASASSEAIYVFYRTSDGTESSFSATLSNSTTTITYLINFKGSRTPDKFASTSWSSNNAVAIPALTSPTSGAAVLAAGLYNAGAGSVYLSVGQNGEIPWTPLSTNFNSGNGSGTFVMWQGTVGTNDLYYATLDYPSFSLVAGCSVAMSVY